jgi:hypothetical protein
MMHTENNVKDTNIRNKRAELPKDMQSARMQSPHPMEINAFRGNIAAAGPAEPLQDQQNPIGEEAERMSRDRPETQLHKRSSSRGNFLSIVPSTTLNSKASQQPVKKF